MYVFWLQIHKKKKIKYDPLKFQKSKNSYKEQKFK